MNDSERRVMNPNLHTAVYWLRSVTTCVVILNSWSIRAPGFEPGFPVRGITVVLPLNYAPNRFLIDFCTDVQSNR